MLKALKANPAEALSKSKENLLMLSKACIGSGAYLEATVNIFYYCSTSETVFFFLFVNLRQILSDGKNLIKYGKYVGFIFLSFYTYNIY